MIIHISIIVMYIIFFMGITAAFFIDKNLYSYKFFLSSFIIALVTFFWIVVMDTKDMTFTHLVSSWKQRWKWLLFILLSLHFVSMFVLPAYYIGTQLYSETLDSTLSDVEKSTIIIGIAIIYMFISIILRFTVIDTYLRFLELKGNNKFSLSVNVGEQKWYLFHPIEKDLYLLGNKTNLNECTKFSFIERKELVKEVLDVEHQ